MRLDPLTRDYRAFIEELVTVLQAENTRYYLDTSLLMWLVRVGAAARSEFIAWCDNRPAKTVRVPVWAAHELHRHLVGGSVSRNVQTTLDEIAGKYREFARLAVERAEEAICLAKGHAGRAGYIGEVQQWLARLPQLTSVVAASDSQIRQAAEEVIGFVNERVLVTDIAPFVEKLSLTGEFRFSHHIPPGFHDKKVENRYGDVIIWEEMLADLVRSEGQDAPGQAVLISRDQKTDWVSAASYLRDQDGTERRASREYELDVSRPLPLLLHEFAKRSVAERLYVTHPSFLANVLEYGARRRGEPSGVGQWLAAFYAPDVLDRLGGIALATAAAAADAGPAPPAPMETGSPAAPGDMAAPVPEGAPEAAFDFQGESPATVMAPVVVEEIQRYQSALPAEQPDLIEQWAGEVQQNTVSPFKFGRILADLSIGDFPGWPQQISAVITQLSTLLQPEKLNRVVLAILTSIYFDSYAELRRRPQVYLGTSVLALETSAHLKGAFATLNRFLREADATVPYLPGAARPRVPFKIDIVPGSGKVPNRIRDIRLGAQTALAENLSPDNPRLLSTLLGRSPADGCTGLELRALIAREYLVPHDLMSAADDRKKLTWDAEAGLVTLDTGSEGGLSVLAEEDENG
jgi:hypothetical protein